MNSKQLNLRIANSLAISLFGLSGPLLAQQPAPAAAPAPPIDMEARKQSIVNLERHITERQERVTELADDIMSLDKRVERRIDRVVETLEKSKDSKDSAVSVVRTKEKAIEGLKNTIKRYDQKRREIREAMRKDTATPKETLSSDVRKFDNRIEKRVEQIIGLTKSFTEDEGLDRYDEHSRGGWGWSYNERRKNTDYTQNKKDSRHTKLERKRQVEALEKSMASLKSRNAWLKGELEGKSASAEERELFTNDLTYNEEIIQTRQYQIDRIKTSNTEGNPKPVSRSTAHDLANLLEDTAADVRTDFDAIFAKYAEMSSEREQIAKLTKNLEARKKWMVENGASE